MTMITIADLRDFLEVVDAIRTGDGSREADLPHIPGECWDGVADIIPGVQRGYVDPMNPGWLRDAVELIWQCQEAIAFWEAHGEPYEFLLRYPDEGDVRHGLAAAEFVVDHYRAERDRLARQILAGRPVWHPERYRALNGTLVPACSLVGA